MKISENKAEAIAIIIALPLALYASLKPTLWILGGIINLVGLGWQWVTHLFN